MFLLVMNSKYVTGRYLCRLYVERNLRNFKIYIIKHDNIKLILINVFAIWFDRPSMSQGTVMIQAQNRLHEKDFTVATPEEFAHRFGGTRVINKVSVRFKCLERRARKG